MTVLQAVDLAKEFTGGDGSVLRILDGVSLEVQQGEMVAVVGASGAGKSTLLHVLGALDRPTRGRVTIGGVDLSGLGDEALARLLPVASALGASQLDATAAALAKNDRLIVEELRASSGPAFDVAFTAAAMSSNARALALLGHRVDQRIIGGDARRRSRGCGL